MKKISENFIKKFSVITLFVLAILTLSIVGYDIINNLGVQVYAHDSKVIVIDGMKINNEKELSISLLLANGKEQDIPIYLVYTITGGTGITKSYIMVADNVRFHNGDRVRVSIKTPNIREHISRRFKVDLSSRKVK